MIKAGPDGDHPGSVNSDNVKPGKSNSLVTWVVIFLIVLGYFYTLDYTIMSIQGLPLNFDLTPAQ